MTAHRVLPMQTADFTIADVLAWARTKPADEAYDFGDDRNCALCQFLKETKRSDKPTVIIHEWLDGEFEEWAGGGGKEWRPIPQLVADNLSKEGCNTFGALAKRLETLCPETVVTQSDWSRLDAYLTDIEDVARERVSA